jgi:flagellar biosynthesis GTPase FlhF
LSAEHKRPLFAFGAVAAFCTFLVLSAVVRGDALSVAFHAPVPISSPAEAPAAAEVQADAAPVAAESVRATLPRELTLRPLARTVVPKAAASRSTSTPDTARTDIAAGSATTTLVETDNLEVEPPARVEEKAQERAQRKAEKAEAKAQRQAEKAEAKAQRQAEKAAAKVQRQAEKAAAKAQRAAEKAAAKVEREVEKAAAKAQRAAEKAQRAAERSVSPAQVHPGQGASKAAEHAHKH